MTAHRDERRRIVDVLQPLRIVTLANRYEHRPEFACRLDFPFGLFARVYLRCRPAAAAPRQSRERVKRGSCAAKMIDQGAKCARSYILAANKAEPVDPLFVIQTNAICRIAH